MHRACWVLAVALLTPSVAIAAPRHGQVQGQPPADPAPPPRLVQPGAPGEPTREIDAAAATDTRGVRHTAADVAFVQGMLMHHAQALEMTALVSTHTSSDDIARLAERIAASQADEMRMMREWLARRGMPDVAAHAHHHGDAQMPGMLTPAQMDALRAARGAEFDRLFLDGMIRHHAGALVMVGDLLAQPGAGQEPELFAFVSDVEADQGMEIRRMGRMLAERTR